MTLDLQTLQKELHNFLTSHKDIGVLGVFGSYAKGTHTTKSDVDICVAKSSPLSLNEKIELANKLSILLGKEVDLLDLNQSHGVILEEALHSAVWITRDNNLFAALLKRMLLDKADFGPLYQRMIDKKRERFLKK